jgi:four helix bundle protein
MYDNRETAMRETRKPQHIKDRTFDFAVDIVGFCQKLDVQGGVNRTMGRQLLGCETSIGANIEEAQAGQSSADFISKCSIALKEARETVYWLRVLEASDQYSGADLKTLLREADEISRIIGAIIVRAKNGQTKR